MLTLNSRPTQGSWFSLPSETLYCEGMIPISCTSLTIKGPAAFLPQYCSVTIAVRQGRIQATLIGGTGGGGGGGEEVCVLATDAISHLTTIHTRQYPARSDGGEEGGRGRAGGGGGGGGGGGAGMWGPGKTGCHDQSRARNQPCSYCASAPVTLLLSFSQTFGTGPELAC